MSIDDIKPALQPLHPDKPEPPIVVGDVWQKIASGKTSVNAPKVKIRGVQRSGNGTVWVEFLCLRTHEVAFSKETIFRRDWRPC